MSSEKMMVSSASWHVFEIDPAFENTSQEVTSLICFWPAACWASGPDYFPASLCCRAAVDRVCRSIWQ